VRNPSKKPVHTSRGVCELSHNLADIISPAVSIAAIRNQVNGVCIFIERITTRAVRAPAPVE